MVSIFFITCLYGLAPLAHGGCVSGAGSAGCGGLGAVSPQSRGFWGRLVPKLELRINLLVNLLCIITR